jgi:hypothetical protein
MLRSQTATLATLALLAATAACTDNIESTPPLEQPVGGWTPGNMLPSLDTSLRGMLDRRGMIHAHSVYSHDACDGEPRDETTDAINEPCFDDFRRGLCQAGHDFVMLTDHGESFSRTEYPDTLLYRPDRGDELVERGGAPVASWAACPVAEDIDPNHRTLVMAGTESNTMPVGLEAHVAPDEDSRNAIYGAVEVASVDAYKALGGVVLLQHTEDWTPEQIRDLQVDGFEMFNLHANTITGAGGVFELIGLQRTPEKLPQSDLVLMPILNEDPRYLATWSTVLARGDKRVTTIGTDCHRNTFPQELPDGERIDSYRRMMSWMSNHLLVRPDGKGEYDDQQVKEALRSGRLYGAFEVFGFPEGFDYRADAAGNTYEMGEDVPLADAPELVVERPRVRERDPVLEEPIIRLRILKAEEDGWRVVDDSDTESLRYMVTEAGSYRAEVRITPRHLTRYLASFADLAEEEFQWIYANAIYVTP